jgi:hypothetical protein
MTAPRAPRGPQRGQFRNWRTPCDRQRTSRIPAGATGAHAGGLSLTRPHPFHIGGST